MKEVTIQKLSKESYIDSLYCVHRDGCGYSYIMHVNPLNNILENTLEKNRGKLTKAKKEAFGKYYDAIKHTISPARTLQVKQCRDLPNLKGFECAIVFKEDTEIAKAKVFQDEKGLHYIGYTDGQEWYSVECSELLGWITLQEFNNLKAQ